MLYGYFYLIKGNEYDFHQWHRFLSKQVTHVAYYLFKYSSLKHQGLYRIMKKLLMIHSVHLNA